MSNKIKLFVITMLATIMLSSCIFVPIGDYDGEYGYGYNNVYYVAETNTTNYDYSIKPRYNLSDLSETGITSSDTNSVDTFNVDIYKNSQRKSFNEYLLRSYIKKYRENDIDIENKIVSILLSEGHHVVFFRSNKAGTNKEIIYCISK